MDKMKLLRTLMLGASILIGGVLLTSVHLEFTADADGTKHMIIDVYREKSGNDRRSVSDTSSINDPIVKIEQSNRKVEQATQFFNQKQYAETIRVATEAIDLNPNNSMAYTFRGNGYAEMKDYAQAIKDYTRAIELDTNNALAYYNRGLAYEHSFDHKSAVIDLTKAIELSPTSAEPYYNRGGAYLNMTEYAKSIEDNTRAIELNPNYAAAYYNRGVCRRLTGDPKAAQSDLDRAASFGFVKK